MCQIFYITTRWNRQILNTCYHFFFSDDVWHHEDKKRKWKCPYLVSITFNITLQKGQIEQRHLYSRQKSQTSNVDDGGNIEFVWRIIWLWTDFLKHGGRGGWAGQLDRNSIKLWNMKENSTWRLKAPDGQSIVDCYGQIVTQVKAKPISW